MPQRKRAVLATLILLNGLSIPVFVRQDATPGPANLLYAYLTSDSFIAMRGTQVVAKASGQFNYDTTPVWSLDGRYVAALDSTDESPKVAVIDAKTQTSRHIP